jgi:Amiloride-sensitive sodium channel
VSAYKGVTDYGSCCLIVPYLYLENPHTRNVHSSQLDNNLFHNIPKGVKNGIQNGLMMVLDVESFDHAYFSRSAKGFRIALTNAQDKPVINLGGQFVAPGKF